MKYKIAICDDSDGDRQYVLNMVKAWAAASSHEIQTDLFPSAESFLFHYAQERDYDILLLDIEMGAMDGVSLAKQIRKDNDTVQIVFVTGYPDHMAQGYDVAALHYLMKPVREEQLFAVLDRAAGALQKRERFLLLPVEGEKGSYPTVNGSGEEEIKKLHGCLPCSIVQKPGGPAGPLLWTAAGAFRHPV